MTVWRGSVSVLSQRLCSCHFLWISAVLLWSLHLYCYSSSGHKQLLLCYIFVSQIWITHLHSKKSRIYLTCWCLSCTCVLPGVHWPSLLEMFLSPLSDLTTPSCLFLMHTRPSVPGSSTELSPHSQNHLTLRTVYDDTVFTVSHWQTLFWNTWTISRCRVIYVFCRCVNPSHPHFWETVTDLCQLTWRVTVSSSNCFFLVSFTFLAFCWPH